MDKETKSPIDLVTELLAIMTALTVETKPDTFTVDV